MGGGVQLPDDVESRGYQRSKKNPFLFDQVFYSPKHDFLGTEAEFVKAGIAYEFIQIDKNTRVVINR